MSSRRGWICMVGLGCPLFPSVLDLFCAIRSFDPFPPTPLLLLLVVFQLRTELFPWSVLARWKHDSALFLYPSDGGFKSGPSRQFHSKIASGHIEAKDVMSVHYRAEPGSTLDPAPCSFCSTVRHSTMSGKSQLKIVMVSSF